MGNNPTNTSEYYAKQAKLLDERAERAEVRRARALKLGNTREADGAMRTIEEAQQGARQFRAQIT